MPVTVTVTLPGPAPWGFRISGGRDFGKPIAVSKVGTPHVSPGLSGERILFAVLEGSCSVGTAHGDTGGAPVAPGLGCAKFPGVVSKALVPSWQRGWFCSEHPQQGGDRGLRLHGGVPEPSRVPFSLEVTEHGKAATGDLRPGDVIVTINGESTAEMLNVEAQNKIKQSPGQLRLEVER